MPRKPHRSLIEARPSPWFWAILPLFSCAGACEAPTPPPAGDLPEAALERRQDAPDRSRPPEARGGQPITYTISRGGTLRNVANLYKLYHHEIAALNPNVDPDRELEPSTEVIVFRDLGRPSESVGYPHDGVIDNALPMVDGPGRKITAERWKTWATRDTIEQLDHVLERWSQVERHAPPVLVGNLSAREGGPLAPHKSHQSGRDVDLSYITKWDGKGKVNWQHVTADNLDAELTWRLIKLLTQNARVEVIYMDRRIQKLLLDHARRHGTIRNARLGNWLEVAGGSDAALIRHVAGHQDHFHVRFACPDGSRKCKS